MEIFALSLLLASFFVNLFYIFCIFFFLNLFCSASSKLHFSMENLPKSCTTRQTTASSCLSSPSSSFLSSQSCDSIYRSNFAKQTPKLPVAQSTARILERVQTENRTTELSATKSTEKWVSSLRASCSRLFCENEYRWQNIGRKTATWTRRQKKNWTKNLFLSDNGEKNAVDEKIRFPNRVDNRLMNDNSNDGSDWWHSDAHSQHLSYFYFAFIHLDTFVFRCVVVGSRANQWWRCASLVTFTSKQICREPSSFICATNGQTKRTKRETTGNSFSMAKKQFISHFNRISRFHGRRTLLMLAHDIAIWSTGNRRFVDLWLNDSFEIYSKTIPFSRFNKNRNDERIKISAASIIFMPFVPLFASLRVSSMHSLCCRWASECTIWSHVKKITKRRANSSP